MRQGAVPRCVPEAARLAARAQTVLKASSFGSSEANGEKWRGMLPIVLRSIRPRTSAALALRLCHALGSAMLAAAVLFVIDLPPALGAETHRIKPVLVVTADGVIVAVTVGANHRVGASIRVWPVPLAMTCGVRGT